MNNYVGTSKKFLATRAQRFQLLMLIFEHLSLAIYSRLNKFERPELRHAVNYISILFFLVAHFYYVFMFTMYSVNCLLEVFTVCL